MNTYTRILCANDLRAHTFLKLLLLIFVHTVRKHNMYVRKYLPQLTLHLVGYVCKTLFTKLSKFLRKYPLIFTKNQQTVMCIRAYFATYLSIFVNKRIQNLFFKNTSIFENILLRIFSIRVVNKSVSQI